MKEVADSAEIGSHGGYGVVPFAGVNTEVKKDRGEGEKGRRGERVSGWRWMRGERKEKENTMERLRRCKYPAVERHIHKYQTNLHPCIFQPISHSALRLLGLRKQCKAYATQSSLHDLKLSWLRWMRTSCCEEWRCESGGSDEGGDMHFCRLCGE